MTTQPSIPEDSAAVQSHLTILQSVIQRMANNSASSKTWCITLASAILVVMADKNEPRLAIIAIIPVVLFLLLDAYYLSLEKGYRKSYNTFIGKLHSSKITVDDLFVVASEGSKIGNLLASLASFSIWPFYLTLLVMLIIAKRFI
jgi:hypothetical protein